MRIIAKSTLINFWKKFPETEQALKSWYDEVSNAEWSSPNRLKDQYKNASVINKKRVVFNITGNKFRLIVDIEYRLKLVFIVWLGAHIEYDRINIKEIKYVKSN